MSKKERREAMKELLKTQEARIRALNKRVSELSEDLMKSKDKYDLLYVKHRYSKERRLLAAVIRMYKTSGVITDDLIEKAEGAIEQ